VAVTAALGAMLAAARDGSNMIGPMLDATRAEATLGEICGVLRDEWGVYTEPAGF
jgi:methylmalonyl-CoA mutase N-terminal domain/subunit